MSLHSNNSNIKNQINKTPKAIEEGKIKIGNIEIDCAILDNGKQVITQSSILRLMGRGNPGGRPGKKISELRKAGVQIPVFISAFNLIPFIPSTLSASCSPILFTPKHGGFAKGYEAMIIPDICDTYLEARKAGVPLTKDQIPIASTLEIIARGLARVGISGLVLEACGIPSNENDYLQKILNEYVEKLILPWVKRFPQNFFNNYKKLYNLKKENNIPMHIGHFINSYIYKELAPGVLEELKKLNPINENGRRSHAHHQFLTPNKGVVALEKQLIKVNTVMCMSKNKKDFDENYDKVKGVLNE